MQVPLSGNVPQELRSMSLEDKLQFSRQAAEQLVKREIRCPRCGFYLIDVYGRGHHITRVKCNKCKFNELIDTGLFRTVKVQHKSKVAHHGSHRPLR